MVSVCPSICVVAAESACGATPRRALRCAARAAEAPSSQPACQLRHCPAPPARPEICRPPARISSPTVNAAKCVLASLANTAREGAAAERAGVDGPGSFAPHSPRSVHRTVDKQLAPIHSQFARFGSRCLTNGEFTRKIAGEQPRHWPSVGQPLAQSTHARAPEKNQKLSTESPSPRGNPSYKDSYNPSGILCSSKHFLVPG